MSTWKTFRAALAGKELLLRHAGGVEAATRVRVLQDEENPDGLLVMIAGPRQVITFRVNRDTTPVVGEVLNEEPRK